MQRTVCFRASDNDGLLLEEHTLAFRLTPGCERGAAELGVPAGTRVRVELLELSQLVLGTPPQIAVPGIPEINVRDFLEGARRIELRAASSSCADRRVR